MHLLTAKSSRWRRKNKVAVMKADTLLRLEHVGKMEESNRLNFEERTCGQTSTPDGQNSDLLPCQETGDSNSPAKYRRYGARLSGVKVRHKRQALQDMARPLKHWLYKHRDNPYPTKTEKILLALGSHMTLVQVSNWFANARRRLKNTVRQPDLSWALRIKLYNKYIQGNAERLSVCSDDSNSEDEECQPTAICPSGFSRASCHSGLLQKQAGALTRADSANSDDSASPPSKYKSSLLNRYLNDSLQRVMAAAAAADDDLPADHKRRSHSESFSSVECEDDVASPACSSEMETNFVYRMDVEDNPFITLVSTTREIPHSNLDTMEYATAKCDNDQWQDRDPQIRQAQEWKEIHAAVALTSLAHGQSCIRGPDAATRAAAMAMDETHSTGHVTMAAAGAAPTVPVLASCIIQKSSHISEIKTVALAQANSV